MDTNKKTEMKKLMDEILAITMIIKDKFPQFYKHLDEMPLFISTDKKELNSNDFKQYLTTLKTQLKTIQSS